MPVPNSDINPLTHTSHKIVLPFYGYAAIAFLTATVLLFESVPAFTGHYFHPKILAITHTMALGWGTMIILGASHQLVPVLVENKLYSHRMAYISFVLAALGIPLLVYAFYVFDMGWPAKTGGILINSAIVLYVINLGASIADNKKQSIQALFIFTASLWLLLTTLLGLTLVYNFSVPLLPEDSLHYLSLHAHTGMAGWFLLLIIGVVSRLFPMFLLSKYNNPAMLRWIYFLVNAGLLVFAGGFLYFPSTASLLVVAALVMTGIVLFGFYCYSCFKSRIRNQMDSPMRISITSLLLMMVPVIIIGIVLLTAVAASATVALAYGFSILFGWLTAIIIGMTFKTLPFIIWIKCYHEKIGVIKTPNPKEMFGNRAFIVMCLLYLSGFVLFMAGIFLSAIIAMKIAAVLLLTAAALYSFSVFKLFAYKAL